MPVLTSPQGAQTVPSGAWIVGLWIPTHPRDPQHQLCASSWISAELSALHPTLVLGGTRGRGLGTGLVSCCQDAGHSSHVGRCSLWSPSELGKGGHFIHSNPQHTRDLMLGYSVDTGSAQATLLRLEHSSARAEGDPWSSQQHSYTRARVQHCPRASSPGQIFVAVPKSRCWARKRSSTDPEVVARSNQEHR